MPPGILILKLKIKDTICKHSIFCLLFRGFHTNKGVKLLFVQKIDFARPGQCILQSRSRFVAIHCHKDQPNVRCLMRLNV